MASRRIDEGAYREREIRLFRRELDEAKRGTYIEIEQSAGELLADLTDPRDNLATFVERAEWVLGGQFGAGAYYEARRYVVRHGIQETAAWLFLVVASLEWKVPAGRAVAVLRRLPQARRELLLRRLATELEDMACAEHTECADDELMGRLCLQAQIRQAASARRPGRGQN